MTVDTNPSSPGFGRVYVSYTQYMGFKGVGSPTAFPGQKVMFQASSDGGLTWTARQIIVNIPNNDNSPNGTFLNVPFVNLATGPQGEVYVTYTTDNAIFIMTSTNGGNTFSKPMKVADTPIPLFPGYLPQYIFPYLGALPGAGARTYGNTEPPVVVNPVTGKVMVAYNHLTYDSATNIVHGVLDYTTSSDRGATWSTPQTLVDVPGMTVALPNMAIDNMKTAGQNVFIGYLLVQEHPVGTPQGVDSVQRTAFVLSKDGGNTFGPSTIVSDHDSNASAGLARNFDTGFMGDYNFSTFDKDGNIHTAWSDSRNGSNCQAFWAFVNSGGTLLPFDLYAQCPAANLGDIDIYWAKVTP